MMRFQALMKNRMRGTQRKQGLLGRFKIAPVSHLLHIQIIKSIPDILSAFYFIQHSYTLPPQNFSMGKLKGLEIIIKRQAIDSIKPKFKPEFKAYAFSRGEVLEITRLILHFSIRSTRDLQQAKQLLKQNCGGQR